jgi:hypothetical protein
MKPGLPVLAVLLLSAVAALAPLAYATPPDPVWIAGFWDDGDYDDVILLITSAVGVVEARLVSDRSPVQAVVTVLPRADEGPADSRAPSSPQPRAPPVS